MCFSKLPGWFGCRVVVLAGSLVARAADGPRDPAAERATFHFADPELVAECVAVEPQVVSPVAMAWDERGRLFVAEMRDYPESPTGGSIRMLEDRDGDGRYETSTVFADGLPFPNSVLPWHGGVLVTAAPDLWFLRDADGDGVAEERRVLFRGFGKGNQQLRANGLFWGLDGWVYGGNGRSDGEIQSTLPGAPLPQSLRGRDFRFRPDTGATETLAGRCQFGNTRDDWGNRFLSWNTIPVRHEVIPDDCLNRIPQVARLAVDPIADLLPSGDRGEVFPLTPAPLVFNNESLNHFNALAGLSIYRGNALGEAYRGNAFVGESLRNLVHRRVLVPDGPTFQAVRPEAGREFLASEDPWFHPVGFATGPDGALYIADFYRRFVEHPAWVARDTRSRVRWQEGNQHGRIWRVQRRGEARRTAANPFSKSQTIPALITALDTDNGWRRDTAHRLLVERHEVESVAVLETMTPRLRLPEARVAALGAWSALSGSNPGWLLTQLNDPDAHVRAQAARVASSQLSLVSAEDQFHEPWLSLVRGLFWRGRQGESDPAVLLQIALGVGFLDDVEGREETLRRIAERSTNRWVRLAAASGSQRPGALAWVPPPPGRLVRLPPPVAIDAASRAAVVEAYRSALLLAGDPRRGAVHVAARCLGCHYLQGRGQRVGPDLAGATSRSSETLLTDILEPSRQVAPDYSTYEVTPISGEPVVALISGESATRITLRAAGAQDTSFARSEIREIRATGRSLMPDGLEQGLTPQDLADVMAFLHAPDGELLPR